MDSRQEHISSSRPKHAADMSHTHSSTHNYRAPPIVKLYYSRELSFYIHLCSIVEPLIKDTLNKGHNRAKPLYKGHSLRPIVCYTSTFQPPKREQPLYKGQNGWSHNVSIIQTFHCSCRYYWYSNIVSVQYEESWPLKSGLVQGLSWAMAWLTASHSQSKSSCRSVHNNTNI